MEIDYYYYLKIKSANHLDNLLQESNLRKFIDYGASIHTAFNSFPILHKFKMDDKEKQYEGHLSSKKINKYLGENFVPVAAKASSYTINKILNKLSIKGDLWNNE